MHAMCQTLQNWQNGTNIIWIQIETHAPCTKGHQLLARPRFQNWRCAPDTNTSIKGNISRLVHPVLPRCLRRSESGFWVSNLLPAKLKPEPAGGQKHPLNRVENPGDDMSKYHGYNYNHVTLHYYISVIIMKTKQIIIQSAWSLMFWPSLRTAYRPQASFLAARSQQHSRETWSPNSAWNVQTCVKTCQAPLFPRG